MRRLHFGAQTDLLFETVEYIQDSVYPVYVYKTVAYIAYFSKLCNIIYEPVTTFIEGRFCE